ncbi:MAG: hypothetical protein OJI97_16540 [Sphingopyxis sp.]|nr:hypothetical protein [Sphingopyxis sp.]MCW0199753.1 hypothetical protein [Sphingopyxis sp.]
MLKDGERLAAPMRAALIVIPPRGGVQYSSAQRFSDAVCSHAPAIQAGNGAGASDAAAPPAAASTAKTMIACRVGSPFAPQHIAPRTPQRQGHSII